MKINTRWSWWWPRQAGGILGWIYHGAGSGTWTLFGFQYDKWATLAPKGENEVKE